MMKRFNIVMVYDKDFKKILFCKRRKPPYAEKLNLPGGKWEEGETPLEAAYRELEEETGIKKNSITPLYHMIDFSYYNTNNLVEFYVCRLTEDVNLIEEPGGNKLVWIEIDGTDFGDDSIFAGDGNIHHCFLIAERNRKLIEAQSGGR